MPEDRRMVPGLTLRSGGVSLEWRGWVVWDFTGAAVLRGREKPKFLDTVLRD